MSAGTGLYSQVGIATESTYGTYVAPTRFYHLSGWDIQPEFARVQSDTFTAGQLQADGRGYVDTTFGASGQISTEVMSHGWGMLLTAALGSVSSAMVGDGPGYKHTFALASTVGKSLTVQGTRPVGGGSAVPLTMVGGKVTSLELSCQTDGLLTATVGLDGRNVDNTTAAATATYAAAARPFSGVGMCVSVGPKGSEVEVSGVKGAELSLARSLDTGRHYSCGSGLKDEPVEADVSSFTGSLSLDWLGKTFEDYALANEALSLIVTWTGAEIETGVSYELTVRLPAVWFEPASQGVDGRGTLSREWSFESKADGTADVPTVEYVTTDATP